MTTAEYHIRQWATKRAMWIAWRMPRWLVSWCYIRVVSHATTRPRWDCVELLDLNVMEALRRWDEGELKPGTTDFDWIGPGKW